MPSAGYQKPESAKFIPAPEVALLLRAPMEAGAVRDGHLFACLFFLACRVGEAVLLRPEHFDLAHGCVRVPTLKKRRAKKTKMVEAAGRTTYTPPTEEARAAARAAPPPLIEVPVLPEAEGPLAAVAAWAAGRAWCFPGGRAGRPITVRLAETRFALWRDALKLDHAYTSHSLRHSCGSLLAERTKDPVLVRDFLRHSNVSTTNTYLHRGPNRWRGAAGALALG